MLRPIVWFVAASMWTTILHECAHACAAFALGVRSTLFNYSANLDLTEAQAASTAPAIIRIAGPLFCLGFGLFSWLGFRRARGSAAALPLLYLSVFGIATFFGNLMSTSFVGDFSSAAEALRLPLPVRHTLTAIGAVAVAAIHFRAGLELARSVPGQLGRVAGTIGIIALPVVVGTAAVMLANQPMPAASMNVRVAEASFWLFAVLGALVARSDPEVRGTEFRLRWIDGAVTVVAILAVRLMVRGIPFEP